MERQGQKRIKTVDNFTVRMSDNVAALNKEINMNLELSDFMYNEIESLPANKKTELFEVLKKLNIRDYRGINILLKVSQRLYGDDSLLLAVQVQDDYIQEIIYNRPHFTTENKIVSIHNASKKSEGTHIIKYGNLFLNTERNGNISANGNLGGGESRSLGLFTSDMQFIEELYLKITDPEGKKQKSKLINSENNGYSSSDENLYGNDITVKRKRVINGALFERLEVSNTGESDYTLKIVTSSSIKDVFEVRGKICTEYKHMDILSDYDGNTIINSCQESGDTYGIKINALFDDQIICPECIDNRVIYTVNIAPDSNIKINIAYHPVLNGFALVDGETVTDPPSTFDEALNIILNSKKSQFAQIRIEGDIPDLQKTVDKCLNDLNMLISYINIDGKSYSYIDAGLPRYAALFGRDSIITALETFPLNLDLAKDTLELLAKFQGESFEERHKVELSEIRKSDWSAAVKNAAIKGIKNLYIQKEEASGKILHELRVGEFAKTGVIPHSPYYGTVDATPLWIILFCEYIKWNQDEMFLNKYIKHAERALDWIENNTINGYLRFTGDMHSKVKIQNQGWKDAGDSIRHEINNRGYLCDPEYPVALAEVQAYVYKAYNMMSDLYKELDHVKSIDFMEKAENLKQRFNHDFWLENEGFYTMALNRHNKAIVNHTSNIGHCLSMGIIDNAKCDMIENRLMSEEIFTGWGLRTLSCNHPAYDSISYHNGSVWVHDSAFCATGFNHENLCQVTKSLFEAANMFEDNRLPELFGGFHRKPEDNHIQQYPEACSPQAWASGALIWLLLRIIKLNSFSNNVIYSTNSLPDWIASLSIAGIKTKLNKFDIKINSIK